MKYYLNLIIYKFKYFKNLDKEYIYSYKNLKIKLKGDISLLALSKTIKILPERFYIENIKYIEYNKFNLISIKIDIQKLNEEKFLSFKSKLTTLTKELSIKIKLIPEDLFKDLYLLN